MDERDNLHWHALNYRTAAPQHAEAMWQELEACVDRMTDPSAGRMLLGGAVLAFNEGMVNIEDVLREWPGGLIRCCCDPREALLVLQSELPITAGCVAGWGSDEA